MYPGGSGTWPQHVGILAIEAYVPLLKIHQRALEEAHGVPGKYTVGLGQEEMAVCSDHEDVVSMALSAVSSLLAKYTVDATSIGRVEVGTETGLDRSKSVKSHLMALFNAHGAHDIEGVDSTHGCYGGTAALFNTAAWVESRAWDGRLGLVVATDVALYPLDSASCATGGCGAIAMLVGPDAPLALEPRWRAAYSGHCYDFYKPVGSTSAYPVVDGPTTVAQFLTAIDACAAALHRKVQPRAGLLAEVQHYCSHAPFNKLARKGLARLVLQDALRARGSQVAPPGLPELPAEVACLDPDNLPQFSRDDKLLERLLMDAVARSYDAKMAASAAAQKLVGNTYTSSIYVALASLVEAGHADLAGSRILMFSFGSGTCASLFALRARHTGSAAFSLAAMAVKLKLQQCLAAREGITWQQLQRHVGRLEAAFGTAPFQPKGPAAHIRPGAFYLEGVDSRWRRAYRQQPLVPAPSSAEDANHA